MSIPRKLFYSLCLFSLHVSTFAGNVSTDLNVSATVVNVCTVNTSSLNFGSYQPGSPASTVSTVPIQVLCNIGTAYTLTADFGKNATGGQRRMRMDGGTEMLMYEIFRDVLQTSVFGATRGAGLVGVGTGMAIPTVLYGVIPPGQQVPGGTYTDQLIITVDY